MKVRATGEGMLCSALEREKPESWNARSVLRWCSWNGDGGYL